MSHAITLKQGSALDLSSRVVRYELTDGWLIVYDVTTMPNELLFATPRENVVTVMISAQSRKEH